MDSDFKVGAVDSVAALPNILLIGRLLLVTDAIEFRLLGLIFGGVFPSPLAIAEGTDDAELVVREESPDFVLTASRELGDEDLDTAGEFQERRAKFTIDSETERVSPGLGGFSLGVVCADNSISAMVSVGCEDAVIMILGVSVRVSGATLMCSELRLLQSSLVAPGGVIWLSLF